MRHVFTFFFRLFFTFLAAKLLVFLVDWHGRAPLLAITLGLMSNVYFFDYLDHRSRSSWRRHTAGPPPAAPTVPGAIPEPPPEART